MRNLSLILLILPTVLFSQTKIINKNEEGFVLKFKNTAEVYIESEKDGYKLIDFIYQLDESKPGLPKLPSRVFYLAIPPEAKIDISISEKFTTEKENVLLATNPKVELENDSTLNYTVTNFDESLFYKSFYPENEIEVVGYIWIRDFYVAVIKLNTHRFSILDKKLVIIDSCVISAKMVDSNKPFPRNNNPLTPFDEMLRDVIINFDDAIKYKSFNPNLALNDTTGNWIDYSKQYIKLAIPTGNVFRITYNDLVSWGVNLSIINPKTFKLFNRGKEQPIFVFGEEDEQFNPNDYIEFYAERNYTYQNYRQIVGVRQDYIQYLNRYTDTSIVWLTWDGMNGKRINLVNNQISTTTDTVNSHLVKIHLEKDVRIWYYDAVVPRVQLPFWQENKTFTWLLIGNSGSTSVTFPARDFLANTPVNVVARLISYASSGGTNAHKNGISLNNTTSQDTITYNFKQTVNFSKIFSSNQLIQGTNTIRIFGLPSAASFHQSLIDWVDVDYYRRNVAINDTLMIIIPDSVLQAERVIRVDNISDVDNLIVYKIFPEFKKFVNFQVQGSYPSTIYFVDTVKGGDKYFITISSKVSQPIFKKLKTFANLRNSSRGADYILISNKILENSSNIYKSFIQNNYNIRVELVFDEDIYDEFSFGMLSAEAIKDFLKVAYNSWTPPKPSFLTILGDANFDYKDVVSPAPIPRKKNIVTSFGFPVSDAWYVMWDTVNIYFPQMFVGRIPANNDNQALFYLQKHQTYVSRKYDEFNKLFLFFSGGDGNKPNEVAQIIATNDYILNNLVRTSPLFGLGTHFYKTFNPSTNFGPYTLEEVQQKIDEGGLFISYIGHSGTRTWDNSISEVEHLKNKYNDRFPLITDFGCSTGKFAEPDVDAFGEIFVCQSPNGQAIAYLGNSSWGYLSTSLRFPRYFYEALLRDSIKTIGRIHTLSKIRQLNETGLSDVNLVFTYCNLLFGDPIIGFPVPDKANLSINESKISLITNQPNDQMDSAKFRVIISNLGIVTGDSIKIKFKDTSGDSIIFTSEFYIPFTKNFDTLIISIPVKNIIGNRTFKVILDPQNLVNEIYEDDNSAEFNYVINSTSLSSIEASDYYNTYRDTLIVLNPFIRRLNDNERILLEIASSENFDQPIVVYKNFDSLITRIPLPNLLPNQRYFYRMRVDNLSSYWTKPKSFIQKFPGYKIYTDRPLDNQTDFVYNNTFFDTLSMSWKLSSKKIALKIQSAGANDGSFGSIQLNGYEQLPNTYYWGLATAIIDSITLGLSNIRYFQVPDVGVRDSLINYINSLPINTWLAMTVSADAQQNIMSTAVRNAIKQIGSKYIDSLKYRESWCILGKKGAQIGSVPEDYKKLFTGVAQIEISKNLTYDSGYVVFPVISNSGNWKYIKLETLRPENSRIIYVPLGIRKDGLIDTLWNLLTDKDSISLTSVDAKVYPSLKLIAKLYANESKQTPEIFSLGCEFDLAPELAVNYQTISTDKDTIYQGESINYYAKIVNVGQSRTDSFKVLLELIKNDNSSIVLIDTFISNLNPGSFIFLSHTSMNKFYDGYGEFSFRLFIDLDNQINELFENNNFFIQSFYVKKDTTTSVSSSSITVKINNKVIYDWDYVEPDASILLEFNYPIWFPVTDTSAIQIYLDGSRVYSNDLIYHNDSTIRKISILYPVKLSKGEHNLKVFTKDVYGRIQSQPVVNKYFRVTSDLEILRIYNYPNPFANHTYFTFVLTHIPDEMTIKIYTIAGRLIREIKLSSIDLTTNFNKVLWDGRDEDGDLLGNGVYLYKVIAKKGERTQSIIQKLAIVR